MAFDYWEIKRNLRHGDLAKVAAKVGVTKGHVTQVVQGTRRDRRVEVAVARKIGRRHADVFPLVAASESAA